MTYQTLLKMPQYCRHMMYLWHDTCLSPLSGRSRFRYASRWITHYWVGYDLTGVMLEDLS
ncbi:MAG: hypothetical protein AVDCRST_MAG93-9132 [uncultured Chloroflexia bacterium]|uniref:Uncharacterized protein n=1 Tax=uncultured Chloroflexia bacterium TaxID=1672391 RepID=A0A6J4N846_9CHLR|nr:MAG: hypothetical protein AVDCRST_MAG93-9132 [uncultured Chloroflexia bacterium]